MSQAVNLAQEIDIMEHPPDKKQAKSVWYQWK